MAWAMAPTSSLRSVSGMATSSLPLAMIDMAPVMRRTGATIRMDSCTPRKTAAATRISPPTARAMKEAVIADACSASRTFIRSISISRISVTALVMWVTRTRSPESITTRRAASIREGSSAASVSGVPNSVRQAAASVLAFSTSACSSGVRLAAPRAATEASNCSQPLR